MAHRELTTSSTQFEWVKRRGVDSIKKGWPTQQEKQTSVVTKAEGISRRKRAPQINASVGSWNQREVCFFSNFFYFRELN